MGASGSRSQYGPKEYRLAMSYQRAFPNGIPDYFHGQIDRDTSLQRITEHSIETGCFLVRLRSEMSSKMVTYVLSVLVSPEQAEGPGIQGRVQHFIIKDDGRKFAITGKHPKTGVEQDLLFDSIEDLLDRCDASSLNSFLNTPINTPAVCDASTTKSIVRFARNASGDDSIKPAASSNNRRQSAGTAGIAEDEQHYVAPVRSVSLRQAPTTSELPPLPPRAASVRSNPYTAPVYAEVEDARGVNLNEAGQYTDLDGTQNRYGATAAPAGVAVEGQYTALQDHAMYDSVPPIDGGSS